MKLKKTMLKLLIGATSLVIAQLLSAAEPLLGPLPDQTVRDSLETFTVDLQVTDADGDTLLLSQTISDANIATLSIINYWSQWGADLDGEAAGDNSGRCVALSADGLTLAVGARLNDGNGIDSGHVRVYQYATGVWTDINGEAAGDNSGDAVALSADGLTLAIGAPNNDGNGADSGQVRIYHYDSGTWIQVGADIDGEAINDKSGTSVSLSADGATVAIGAAYNDGNGVDSGHVRIYTNLAGVWTQVGTDIDGKAANNQSGASVSLSADGSTVAIGAILNSDNGAYSGQVRIYKNIAGIWTQIGADINGKAAGDRNGVSVSISADGSIVAIGAYNNDDNGTDSGQVRIFKNIAGVWTQLGAGINGEASSDYSGRSVALSHDGLTVAIGAFFNNGNGTDSGQTRVYQYNAGTWIQLGTDIDGEAAGDYSGYAVALSANGLTLAAGAFRNDGNGVNSGHTRIYQLNRVLSITPKADAKGSAVVTLNAMDGTGSETNTTFNLNVDNVADAPAIIPIPDQNVTINAVAFTVDVNATDGDNDTLFLSQTISDANLATVQMTQLWTKDGTDINVEAAIDLNDTSVAFRADGSTIAIGTPFDNTNGEESGQVRIYKNNAGVWTQLGVAINGETATDQSGTSVALSASGLTLAIGAPGNDANGADSGHVRVYHFNLGVWTQVGADIDGEAANDISGVSVSLSADGFTLAIGASGNDGNGNASGHVRIYKNSAGTWTQVGTDIDGEAAGDGSGSSVALNADGSAVAIGATGNSGNGISSGHVRVYKNIAGVWTRVGADIDGEAAYDYSGSSVALSADGLSVAIGAPYNDGNGNASGHVRVYKNIAGVWTQVGADIDGEAAGEQSGSFILLSADALTLAVGGPWNNGIVTGGRLRLYQLGNRLSITPKPNAVGSAVITVNAMDGTGSDTNSSFNLNIASVATSSSSSAVSSTASSSSSSSSAVVVSSSSSSLSSAVSSSSSSSLSSTPTSSSSSSSSSVASISSSSSSVAAPDDTDGDGINDTIEQSVPNPNENGYGDGNGDNTEDYMQAYVSAVQGTNGWLVLSNVQHYSQSGLNIQTSPADAPDDVSFPYGFITFQINGVTPGDSVAIELYVPYDENINGYWKKDNSGNWHNIATSINHEGTMTKISFTLTDGDAFDSDGNVNGVITDPGAPGARTATVSVPLSNSAKVLLLLLFLVSASLFMKRRHRA